MICRSLCIDDMSSEDYFSRKIHHTSCYFRVILAKFYLFQKNVTVVCFIQNHTFDKCLIFITVHVLSCIQQVYIYKVYICKLSKMIYIELYSQILFSYEESGILCLVQSIEWYNNYLIYLTCGPNFWGTSLKWSFSKK